MSHDLVINPHPNQLPFNKPPKGIRSSSFRVTNSAKCHNSISPLGRQTEGVVAKYPKGAEYSKSSKHTKGKPQLNRFLKQEGGFDLDSFRLCAAVNRVFFSTKKTKAPGGMGRITTYCKAVGSAVEIFTAGNAVNKAKKRPPQA
jgi:hypothetical protein